jgi:hypothetical protein
MIYYVLFCHWLNDFLGQSLLFPSLKIGRNKSKSWGILGTHIVLYTGGMTFCMLPFLNIHQLMVFAAINGGSHFLIDAITSRISSRAYAAGNESLFWGTIGFDQFLHTAILCATLPA